MSYTFTNLKHKAQSIATAVFTPIFGLFTHPKVKRAASAVKNGFMAVKNTVVNIGNAVLDGIANRVNPVINKIQTFNMAYELKHSRIGRFLSSFRSHRADHSDRDVSYADSVSSSEDSVVFLDYSGEDSYDYDLVNNDESEEGWEYSESIVILPKEDSVTPLTSTYALIEKRAGRRMSVSAIEDSSEDMAMEVPTMGVVDYAKLDFVNPRDVTLTNASAKHARRMSIGSIEDSSDDITMEVPKIGFVDYTIHNADSVSVINTAPSKSFSLFGRTIKLPIFKSHAKACAQEAIEMSTVTPSAGSKWIC